MGGIVFRSAFTVDVPTNSKLDEVVIAFRGLRIQTIKATRESITYVVLSWAPGTNIYSHETIAV